MPIKSIFQEGKDGRKQGRPIIRLGLALVLIAFLSACGGDGAAPEDNPPPGETQTVAPSQPDSQAELEAPIAGDAIQILWQESVHASTYVQDEAGENSTCARCHAPVNWIPSMDDMPESCSSCKFEIDPPPPVITENEWTHIECKVCHQYKKDELLPGISWLEIAAIDEYSAVESVTVLCDKCHLAAEVLSHGSVVVGGDHAGYACTDCHDAHSTAATCTDAGCHPVAMDGSDEVQGHDGDHELVGCSACHDGSAMDVGPLEDTGVWTTFLPGGTIAFDFHQSQTAVDCSRCHYSGNPWGLSESEGP